MHGAHWGGLIHHLTTAFLFMTSELPHKPWLFYWAPDKTFNLPSQHPCPGIPCRHLKCSLSNTEFIPQVSAELLLLFLVVWDQTLIKKGLNILWKSRCDIPPEGLRIPPWVPTAFESWSNTYSSFTAYQPIVMIPTKALLSKSHGKCLSGLEMSSCQGWWPCLTVSSPILSCKSLLVKFLFIFPIWRRFFPKSKSGG